MTDDALHTHNNHLTFDLDCSGRTAPEVHAELRLDLFEIGSVFRVTAVTSYHPPRMTPWGVLSTHQVKAIRVR